MKLLSKVSVIALDAGDDQSGSYTNTQSDDSSYYAIGEDS